MTSYLLTKNVAQKKQEINEGNAIGCPKLISADSCSQINGLKGPRAAPGRPKS